jgi:hypothetical protein
MKIRIIMDLTKLNKLKKTELIELCIKLDGMYKDMYSRREMAMANGRVAAAISLARGELLTDEQKETIENSWNILFCRKEWFIEKLKCTVQNPEYFDSKTPKEVMDELQTIQHRADKAFQEQTKEKINE